MSFKKIYFNSLIFSKLMQNRLFLALIFVMFIIILLHACRDDDISEPNEIEKSENRKNVGHSANDFLSTSNYNKLILVIQYMDGFKPHDLTVQRIEEFLNERLNKSNGIEVILQQIPAKNESPYSTTKIRAIEDEYRELYNKDKTLTAYALFIDGSSDKDNQNSKVLGIAYYNTSVLMFGKTIRDLTGGIGQPSRNMVETTVFKHEIGHLLGLVDIGSPMQTDHKGQNGHCNNDNCLMYHTMNTGDVINILLSGGTIPELDQNCINDLKANGGK